MLKKLVACTKDLGSRAEAESPSTFVFESTLREGHMLAGITGALDSNSS